MREKDANNLERIEKMEKMKRNSSERIKNLYVYEGLHIFYYLNESMNIQVTLGALNQTIILSPKYFFKVLGIDGVYTTGSRSITFAEASKLGFCFESEVLQSSEELFYIIKRKL